MEGVFTQVVALFVLVIVGYVAARLRIIGPEFNKQMSSFVIQVSNPCLILGSVMGDKVPSVSMIAPLLGVGMLSYAVLAAVAVLISRAFTKNRDDRGIYSFMFTFGNVGFIGYPVVAAIYGTHAIFYACIINFAFTLFAFTIGMQMVKGDKGGPMHFDWHVLVSPAMICSYAAIVLVVLGVDDYPDAVSAPVTLLGSLTVPAALVIIGSSLAQMPVRKVMGTPRVWLAAMCRLSVMPLAVLAVTLPLGLAHDVTAINFILAAMPVGSFGTMFCLQCGRDERLMVQGTFVSTLLSVATIPVVVMLALRFI